MIGEAVPLRVSPGHRLPLHCEDTRDIVDTTTSTYKTAKMRK